MGRLSPAGRGRRGERRARRVVYRAGGPTAVVPIPAGRRARRSRRGAGLLASYFAEDVETQEISTPTACGGSATSPRKTESLRDHLHVSAAHLVPRPSELCRHLDGLVLVADVEANGRLPPLFEGSSVGTASPGPVATRSWVPASPSKTWVGVEGLAFTCPISANGSLTRRAVRRSSTRRGRCNESRNSSASARTGSQPRRANGSAGSGCPGAARRVPDGGVWRRVDDIVGERRDCGNNGAEVLGEMFAVAA